MTTPLVDRLPSLLALLYAEAAARHANFTRAAQELHVTQSAVSHQIRALEETLGVALFERTPQGVRPTQEGQDVALAVRQGLGQVAACLEMIAAPRGGAAPSSIALGVSPSLANLWLVGRLTPFQEAHPGWSLLPSVGIHLHNLEQGDVEAALRYGRGGYVGHGSVLLSAERLVAVCAPEVWSVETSPEALRGLAVLEAYSPKSPRGEPPAAYWSRTTGVALGEHLLTFNRQSMAVAAAVEGQGVAIVPWQVARDALARGTLVQPVPHEAPDQMSYFLVWHPSRARPVAIDLLRSWLQTQFRVGV
ncbi:MAG: LysR substrate-binding domain-containing protein [Myxococcota bacterium]